MLTVYTTRPGYLLVSLVYGQLMIRLYALVLILVCVALHQFLLPRSGYFVVGKGTMKYRLKESEYYCKF